MNVFNEDEYGREENASRPADEEKKRAKAMLARSSKHLSNKTTHYYYLTFEEHTNLSLPCYDERPETRIFLTFSGEMGKEGPSRVGEFFIAAFVVPFKRLSLPPHWNI